MHGKIKYQFITSMWKHDSTGGWHFVSVPKEVSNEIRENLGWQEEGWGRMKASAQIGLHKWDTAIWFDTKRDTYILPIKADIRNKTGLNTDTSIEMSLWV